MAKLLDNANNPAATKLSKIQCAAVLTIGFEKYSGTSAKVDDLRDKVKLEIAKGEGEEEKPFWTRQDEIAAKRRKTGDASSAGDASSESSPS